MQGSLTLSGALAEALPHWSSPWQIVPLPVQGSPGYIRAGLPTCQLDQVCPDLVLRVLERAAGDVHEAEQERSLHTAVVSSMCWLQSAGSAGVETILRDGPMSFGHDALGQSLSLIGKAQHVPLVHAVHDANAA